LCPFLLMIEQCENIFANPCSCMTFERNGYKYYTYKWCSTQNNMQMV
jgi:hypothetical protein